MADPSRNFVFGPWTQEDFDRLFRGEMPDIDLIAGYVGSSRYALEDFTESQPVEGEEYVPSTQYLEPAPQQVQVRQGSGQASNGLRSSTSLHRTSTVSTTQAAAHRTAPAVTT